MSLGLFYHNCLTNVYTVKQQDSLDEHARVISSQDTNKNDEKQTNAKGNSNHQQPQNSSSPMMRDAYKPRGHSVRVRY
jgi:hypothetical protein